MPSGQGTATAVLSSAAHWSGLLFDTSCYFYVAVVSVKSQADQAVT